jgi:branched-chain amino acid transport system substrate-binding protein
MKNRFLIRAGFVLLWMLGLSMSVAVLAAEPLRPVTIALTAEFGIRGSQAAQSIEKGILLAIDEINAAGGVLGGRRLALQKADDRGVPARAVDNFIDFAANPDVVAVFCGRFSPVALEMVPYAGKLGLTLLDPWSAADTITANRGSEPNYVFRLSLTDTWAMETMLDHARKNGFKRLALFVPNTAWGRSSEAALVAYQKRHGGLRHETFWFNWGDTEFGDRLAQAVANGAQALIIVANETEGLPIVKKMAELPAAKRLPIISHWGILAGDFAASARGAIEHVDFSVVHTFSFSDAQSPKAQAVGKGLKRLFDIEPTALRAQVGFAHAYDLTHLLAKAVARAGSTDRAAIRQALERLDAHQGLVRHYARPFTPERHEALDRRQVALARFDKDGNLKSIAGR